MNTIKLSIVDDHAILRGSLYSLLNDVDDFEVISMADNGAEFINQLKDAIIPDIVLLDIHMPVMDGFQTATIIKREFKSVKILVLTMYDTKDAISRMFQIGINGYLLKNSVAEELFTTIRAINTYGFYDNEYSRSIQSTDYESENSAVEIPRTLNTRELELLKLVANGLSDTEIAESMYVSLPTVSTYKIKLMEKLKVKNIIGLVKYGISNKLI